jgi:predicted amidohydrolase
MRAHLIQMDITWEDRPGNRRRAKALLDRATQTQGLAPGDLAVLPELFDTGFSFNLAVTADADGATMRFLCDEAAKRQITLVGSRTVLGPDGRGRNRCTVAGPDGSIVCEYDKVHPFSFGKETEHFTGGSRVMLFEWEVPGRSKLSPSRTSIPTPTPGTPPESPVGERAMTWAQRVRAGVFTGPREGGGEGGAGGPATPGAEALAGSTAGLLAFEPYLRVCPTICYDLRFPELYRLGMLSGAELFTVIANWPQSRAAHRRALAVARAIENQAFVLCVNRAGNDPNLKYHGESFAVGPKGELLGEAGPEECVLSVSIEADVLRAWRREFPAWRDVKLLG